MFAMIVYDFDRRVGVLCVLVCLRNGWKPLSLGGGLEYILRKMEKFNQ